MVGFGVTNSEVMMNFGLALANPGVGGGPADCAASGRGTGLLGIGMGGA